MMFHGSHTEATREYVSCNNVRNSFECSGPAQAVIMNDQDRLSYLVDKCLSETMVGLLVVHMSPKARPTARQLPKP